MSDWFGPPTPDQPARQSDSDADQPESDQGGFDHDAAAQDDEELLALGEEPARGPPASEEVLRGILARFNELDRDNADDVVEFTPSAPTATSNLAASPRSAASPSVVPPRTPSTQQQAPIDVDADPEAAQDTSPPPAKKSRSRNFGWPQNSTWIEHVVKSDDGPDKYSPAATHVPVTQRFARCLCTMEDGRPCKSVISLRNARNIVNHLATHKITESSTPRDPNKKVVDIRKAWKLFCPDISHAEDWMLLIARLGIPIRIVQDPTFRRLTDTAINRNTFEAELKVIGDKLMASALLHFKTPTLAMDIGTHKHRYLAFTLIQDGASLYYTMVPQQQVPGATFTKENVYNAVLNVIEELQTHRVVVRGVVADNASNLQAVWTTPQPLPPLRRQAVPPGLHPWAPPGHLPGGVEPGECAHAKLLGRRRLQCRGV